MYRTFSQLCCLALSAQLVICMQSRGTSTRGFLNPRQTDSNIPTQCQSICDPVVSLIDTGCTVQGCCTNTFIRNLTSCFECAGNITQTTNYSIPQSTIDELVEDCASGGFNITDPTLPGQNPNRTLSLASSFTHGSVTASSFLQSTITSVSFAPTFTQNTVTSISSSTPPLGTSSASSASGTVTANSGALPHSGCRWLAMIGSLCVAWALSF
ncbi:hypothetical protein F5050DRAFT_1756133 [Lentinula boryana]|uniref:Uncharacterized protein n=1 Tax=Lentinula boryana TaxID=40481 RepID=A0ABQ8QEG5_9AGAR|nr:hypothetical protein F5050DRAFT_1756133 [Lentinula boryana]